jgi:hypothetical protein
VIYQHVTFRGPNERDADPHGRGWTNCEANTATGAIAAGLRADADARQFLGAGHSLTAWIAADTTVPGQHLVLVRGVMPQDGAGAGT